jgi:hypothetical protein
MDNITPLGAYHDENSAGYRLSKYKGAASPKAKGTDRMVSLEPQNAQEYEIFAIENGLINKKEGKFVGENPE